VLRYLQITWSRRIRLADRRGADDRFLIATVAGWVATFAILIYG